MKHHLATIALGPLLVAQGIYVRRHTPKLPEPPGPRAGIVGDGPPLRLLITGDSAAAGVGASSQDEALSGRLVSDLSSSYRLDWRLEARTGATTRQTLTRLQRLGGSQFDVLVTSLGVNDVTRAISEAEWLAGQRQLRSLARQTLGVSLIIVAGLPPVERFPALPQPLRWYLGQRALHFSRLLRNDLEADPSAHFLDLRFSLDQSLMASDGFHPGPVIYAEWASRVAAIVRTARQG